MILIKLPTILCSVLFYCSIIYYIISSNKIEAHWTYLVWVKRQSTCLFAWIIFSFTLANVSLTWQIQFFQLQEHTEFWLQISGGSQPGNPVQHRLHCYTPVMLESSMERVVKMQSGQNSSSSLWWELSTCQPEPWNNVQSQFRNEHLWYRRLHLHRLQNLFFKHENSTEVCMLKTQQLNTSKFQLFT